MAYTKQLSPGVQIREVDLTSFTPTSGTSGGGFVGQFVWGPVDVPVIIDDPNTLVKVFGEPNDSNYVDWFSAFNFLAYNDNLRLVRVVDNQTASNSSVDGTGRLVKNYQHYQVLSTAEQGTSTDLFVARCPGELGNSIRISMADSNTFETWEYKDQFDYINPGTSAYAASLGASNDEVHIVIVDSYGKFTGTRGAILEKYSFLSKAVDSKGIDNEPNFYGNVLNLVSKYVWYFSPVKGTFDLDIDSHISDITVVNGGTNYGKPIITITDTSPVFEQIATRVFVDTDADGTPDAPANFILTEPGLYRFVPISGDFITSWEDTSGHVVDISISGGGGASGFYSSTEVTVTAEMIAAGGVVTFAQNMGKFECTIGIEKSVTFVSNGTGAKAEATINSSGTITSIKVMNAGNGYKNPIISITDSGTGAKARAVVEGGVITSVIPIDTGENYYTAKVTVGGSGSGASITPVIGDVGTSYEGKILSYIVDNGGSGYGTNPEITVSPGGSNATAKANVASNDAAGTNWGMRIQGSDGTPRTFYSLKKAYDVQLSGGSNGDRAGVNELIGGWEKFKNAEDIDVNLLFAGDAGGSENSKTVIRYIIDNICEYRRDCMLFFSPNLVDILNQTQNDATKKVRDFVTHQINGINRNTSFAVADTGWKLQYDVFGDKYRWIPLNADIAGICAQTETDYDSWWSPAGLNRGKIKNLVSLAFNPNKSSRDDLYKANINSVVSFTGEGTFLYGDRTLLTKNSAFSYINVRRLFITLEKSISRSAKYQLFEFNDEFTRTQFVGSIEPYLRMVKAKRGIYDYKVICDSSNNTSDVIDRSEFVASIFVKPARSINFITLNFVAVRTGVEFSEVVGGV